VSLAALAEPPLHPEDFAYGLALNADGQEALYQTLLPFDVYRVTTRTDLGDVRVFNAQGEIVPHAIRRAAESGSSKRAPAPLPFFPIYGGADKKLDGLQLHVQKDGNGTIIDLKSDAQSDAAPQVVAYLLDISAIKEPIQSLDLDWKAGSAGFSTKVSVAAGDDLAHWSTIVADATLARLEFQGEKLVQRAIELPAVRVKYLRLAWSAGQTPLELTGVQAKLADAVTDSPRLWLAAPATAIAGKPGEYSFDLGAHVPVDRVRVALPQVNTLAQAHLFSRSVVDGPWQSVADATLYRLISGGSEIHSADLVTATRSDRYWLLRVEEKGGGLGQGAPVMHAGWLPRPLLFVARGSGPFRLAYGAANVAPGETSIENLLPDGGATTIKIKGAEPGTPLPLGGVARLSPAAPQFPWKKYLLWGVLVSGVGLLGWMAYRLLKQMDAKPL
jgi:hypothetical protein